MPPRIPCLPSLIRVDHRRAGRSSRKLYERRTSRHAVLAHCATAPSSPAAVEAEFALPTQPRLEVVHGTPTRAYIHMDLDALLWENDANVEEYIDAWEGAGIKTNLNVNDDEQT